MIRDNNRDTPPPGSPVNTAFGALKRAAGATPDSDIENGNLDAAVKLHTADLSRAEMTRLLALMLRTVAMSWNCADHLVATLERVVGGSAERAARALDGPEPGP